ncbi:MAG TPA: hypothetical protein PLJ34_10325, partial [Hyphomicrobiales bacterium]|nr:hypothetical protein [Hyphomicrobiales bacterium]
LIETIFILNVFAEIKVTSVGGFAGNLTYLVFSQLNDANDVGMAAAGGLVAVVLANFVSAFLVRLVGLFDADARASVRSIGLRFEMEHGLAEEMLGRPLIGWREAATAMAQTLLDQQLV